MDYTKIFYTVPLGGSKLTRDETGQKIGYWFPEEWSRFITTRNTINSPLLAAIARKDFIGLDFDTDELFAMAYTLDPDCRYVAQSDKKGGHMLYLWDESMLDFFPKNVILGKLDIQTGNKLITLATPANTTKKILTEPLTRLEDLSPMPPSIRYFVKCLLLEDMKAIITYSNTNNGEYSTLGYIIKDIKETAPFSESILSRITPTRFKGIKHPDDIPDGGGTEYLQAIRTKLALDESVSRESMIQTLLWINAQWQNPMPQSRIIKDCEYQIQSATIASTGEKAWRYNENWDKTGIVVKDIKSNALEYFYVPRTGGAIEYNRTTGDFINFASVMIAKNSLLSKGKKSVASSDFVSRAIPVELINSPKEMDGFIQGDEHSISKFNTFKLSIGAKILRDPELVRESYVYPEYTIKFINNLIPNVKRRNWFLGFIKRKHLTYEYSPIYLLIDGVGGAGKGVLVNTILQYFSGVSRIQEINLEKLTNNFNSWKASTDYAILDEGGEGSSRNDMAKLVAELKKITGTSYISVTYKGKDTSGDDNKEHFITPIVISNIEKKLITDTPKNDRRLVRIKCPNKMKEISGGNDASYYDKIVGELPSFAYWLATEVSSMIRQDYISNESQKDEDYLEYIRNTVDGVTALLSALEDKNLSEFTRILTDDFSISDDQLDLLFHPSIQKPGVAVCVSWFSAVLAGRFSNLAVLNTIEAKLNAVSPREFKNRSSNLTRLENVHDNNGTATKVNVFRFNGEYVRRGIQVIDYEEGIEF